MEAVVEAAKRSKTESTIIEDNPTSGCLLLWLTSAGLPASSKNGLHRGVRGMALSTVEKSNQH